MKEFFKSSLLWGAWSGVVLRFLVLSLHLRVCEILPGDHGIALAGEVAGSVVIYAATSAAIGLAGRLFARTWLSTGFDRALLATLQAIGFFILWFGLWSDRITIGGSRQGPLVLAALALLVIVLFAVGRALRAASPTAARGLLVAIPVVAFGASINAHFHQPLDLKKTAPEMEESGSAQSERQPPNILLLMVDTLRRDYVDFKGNSGSTPNLAKLAESSIVYDDAISVAPWTGPSVASMFTSRYPSEHGLTSRSVRLPEQEITVAEILSAHGYRTVGVVSNSVLGRDFGFNQGFDFYMDARQAFPFGLFLEITSRFWKPHFETTSPFPIKLFFHRVSRSYSLADRTTMNAAALMEQLDRDGRPFFFFLHYMDPHRPFCAPERFMVGDDVDRGLVDGFEYMEYDSTRNGMAIGGTLLGDNDYRRFHELYSGEVRHVDHWIGTLLQRIEDAGLFDNTLILFVADHGEYFGEHNLAAHSHLYEECIGVPLLIRPPAGLQSRRHVRGAVQTMQILPTILAAAGFPGTDTLTTLKPLPTTGAAPDQPLFAEAEDGREQYMRMVRLGKWKLIRSSSGEELYDLDGDSSELVNLRAEAGITGETGTKRDGTAGEALRDLRELLDTFQVSMEKAEKHTISITPEQEEALRALGYMK